MFFTQIEFFFLLAIVLLLVTVIPGNVSRKVVLLIASIYFYGYWDVRFLGLLTGVIAVNYVCALFSGGNGSHRKLWMLMAVVFDAGILAVFKYYNFFTASLLELFPGLRIGMLHWILPMGISFFTFQNISYSADVYWRKTEPCRNLLDFALFVLYFPKLMVGPIVRAKDFFPQLQTRPLWQFDRMYSGVQQFIFGFFEKLFVADYLALFVNEVWTNYPVYDSLTVWFAVLAYTLQIYCDFCGYSNMAIGVSRILGYELCENFNMPYLAESVTEFWHRWHISLSTWLRDYIYIPLGGNRKGVARSYGNQMITMLIGGLWHGAAWTFVFWGAWHGAMLMIHKFWKSHTAGKCQMPRCCAILLTLAVVVIGWIFFRSGTFADALHILKMMVVPVSGICWIEPVSCVLLAGAVLLHIFFEKSWFQKMVYGKCSWLNCTLLWLLLLIVIVFKPQQFQPFIYNQF